MVVRADANVCVNSPEVLRGTPEDRQYCQLLADYAAKAEKAYATGEAIEFDQGAASKTIAAGIEHRKQLEERFFTALGAPDTAPHSLKSLSSMEKAFDAEALDFAKEYKLQGEDVPAWRDYYAIAATAARYGVEFAERLGRASTSGLFRLAAAKDQEPGTRVLHMVERGQRQAYAINAVWKLGDRASGMGDSGASAFDFWWI